MTKKSSLVRDFANLSPVFVYEKSSLFNALETMKNFRIERLPVIKDDFTIVGIITKVKIIETLLNAKRDINALKQEAVNEKLEAFDSPVVLYPRMDIAEAYNIMKYLNISGLPVVELPWDKKMIGFLWLEDIIHTNDTNLAKVSV